MLKWAVTEKFRDYLLGSWFTAYTDNPLAYVKQSKLGAAQIRWLNKLVLFDFDIKCRMCKSNQAADSLIHCPMSSTDISSDSESGEEYKTILHEIVSDDLTDVIHGIKLPIDFKNEIQRIIHEKPERDNIQEISTMVYVLSKVSPEIMR